MHPLPTYNTDAIPLSNRCPAIYIVAMNDTVAWVSFFAQLRQHVQLGVVMVATHQYRSSTPLSKQLNMHAYDVATRLLGAHPKFTDYTTSRNSKPYMVWWLDLMDYMSRQATRHQLGWQHDDHMDEVLEHSKAYLISKAPHECLAGFNIYMNSHDVYPVASLAPTSTAAY